MSMGLLNSRHLPFSIFCLPYKKPHRVDIEMPLALAHSFLLLMGILILPVLGVVARSQPGSSAGLGASVA